MADAIGTEITTPETGAEDPKVAAAAAAAAAAPVVPDKFKNADGSVNTEALLASYVELEKKQGAPAAKEGETPDPNASKTEEKPAEPTAEEKAAAETLKGAGLELTPFNEEFAKDGKLSDESYAKLEKAGFKKDMVDTYIAGIVAGNVAAETAIADIKAAAGGDEGYAAVMAWAKDGLTAAEITEFNEAVESGKPGIAKAAVAALKGKFDAAEGKEPALLEGGSRPSTEVFRSYVEVTAAMSDPRYGKDPAYTSMIEQKVIRSKI